MNIHEKLMTIQAKLKAPKNQFNAFAKYNYRSLEDITEAVKPLLKETKTVLVVEDEPVMISDRVYIKATAHLIDTEDEKSIKNTAFAREPLSKKGSDESQITGATSSYARKYCLNGLFCIDDNKDADSMPPAETAITNAQVKELSGLIDRTGTDLQAFLKHAKADTLETIHPSKFGVLKAMLMTKEQKLKDEK